jgi:hypothetical protein
MLQGCLPTILVMSGISAISEEPQQRYARERLKQLS